MGVYLRIWVVGVCLLVGQHSAVATSSVLAAQSLHAEVIHGHRLVEVTRSEHRFIYPLQPGAVPQAMQAAEGVQTIAELELLSLLRELPKASTEVFDLRSAVDYASATIPGSKHAPVHVFQAKARPDELKAWVTKTLNARVRQQVDGLTLWLERAFASDPGLKSAEWDFSDAKKAVFWCHGDTCGLAPEAIRALRKLGYPASRLFYYRGGIRDWGRHGFTLVEGETGQVVRPGADD